MTGQDILQIITGGIGSVGFAILFNIRGKKLIAAAIGGFLSWAAFLLLMALIPNEPVCYFLVSSLTSVYSEIMARRLKTPTTTFLMTALIPLIPGGSLYYTMVYAFGGISGNFISQGVYTLQLAAALALGIIAVTAVAKTLSKTANSK